MKQKKVIEPIVSNELKTIAKGIRKTQAIPNLVWDGGVIGDQLAILLDGECKIIGYKIALRELIAAMQIDSRFSERFHGRFDIKDFICLYEFFEALDKIPDIHSYFHLLAIKREESLSEKDKTFLIQKYYFKYLSENKQGTHSEDLPF